MRSSSSRFVFDCCERTRSHSHDPNCWHFTFNGVCLLPIKFSDCLTLDSFDSSPEKWMKNSRHNKVMFKAKRKTAFSHLRQIEIANFQKLTSTKNVRNHWRLSRLDGSITFGEHNKWLEIRMQNEMPFFISIQSSRNLFVVQGNRVNENELPNDFQYNSKIISLFSVSSVSRFWFGLVSRAKLAFAYSSFVFISALCFCLVSYVRAQERAAKQLNNGTDTKSMTNQLKFNRSWHRQTVIWCALSFSRSVHLDVHRHHSSSPMNGKKNVVDLYQWHNERISISSNFHSAHSTCSHVCGLWWYVEGNRFVRSIFLIFFLREMSKNERKKERNVRAIASGNANVCPKFIFWPHANQNDLSQTKAIFFCGQTHVLYRLKSKTVAE